MASSIQRIYRNLVLLLCLALLLVMGVALTVSGFRGQQAEARRNLETQARLLATEAAERTASPDLILHRYANAAPDLAIACVLNEKGVVKLYRHGESFDAARPVTCDPAAGWGPQMLTAHAVIPDVTLPTATGEIYLVARLTHRGDLASLWIAFAVAGAAVFGLCCWAAASQLERLLLKPIRQISATAQRVSLYKDYSLRVEPGALETPPREIEALTDSFNAMLHEIEDRDTRLTRKSDELEKSRHAAVAASVAKSQFLANVSHELRTPLNAIIGFSTMLKSQQFGPVGHAKYVEYAQDIHDSGRHLLDVINDILDITKAETGTLSMHFEQLTIDKIVEKAMNIIAGHAHERKIDIYTDIPAKLPKIYADRVRLIQILLNLLSNAIKFSPEGSKVTLRVRAEPAKNQVHYFTLELEDHGIGMTDAEIAKAFSTFNQSDAGLNRKYEGAGLGLPLTKRLVELHHGKIKIVSSKDSGTIVTVRLTSDPALLD